MAAPNLPALGFNAISTTAAANTVTAFLDAIHAAIGTTTGDDGASIATAARWQVTKGGAPTDYVIAEPAATSPIAGKVVLIWAGHSVTTPNAGAMNIDASTANCLYFGMWMANTSSTVDRTDYSSWSAAAPFVAGGGHAGTFTGFYKLYSTGLLMNKWFWLPSTDYVVGQIEETTGGILQCHGGMGIRAPTDAVANCETGLGGRMFDYGVSGAGGVIGATWQGNGAANGSPYYHSITANQGHWQYRIPGATASPMRGISGRAVDTTGGILSSNANMTLCIDGSIEAEVFLCKDIVGSGANNQRTIGRSRAFYMGPRRTSKAILSAGAVKTWIAIGQSTTVNNDAILMPYG